MNPFHKGRPRVSLDTMPSGTTRRQLSARQAGIVIGTPRSRSTQPDNVASIVGIPARSASAMQ